MIFRRKQRVPGADILRCSFCNKTQDDVRKLIAGPTVYICDECVDVCVDILADERRSDASTTGVPPDDSAGAPTNRDSDAWCSFCGNRATLETALLIENRTLLCDSCVSAIASTAADARKQRHSSE